MINPWCSRDGCSELHFWNLIAWICCPALRCRALVKSAYNWNQPAQVGGELDLSYMKSSTAFFPLKNVFNAVDNRSCSMSYRSHELFFKVNNALSGVVVQADSIAPFKRICKESLIEGTRGGRGLLLPRDWWTKDCL